MEDDELRISPEERAHFRVLKALEDHPEYSQRELSKAVGVCLGRVNYVIRGLVEKGLLKAGRLQRSDRRFGKVAYVLTRAGLHHRLMLTRSYIAHRKVEYEFLKAELEALEQEAARSAPEPGKKPKLDRRHAKLRNHREGQQK